MGGHAHDGDLGAGARSSPYYGFLWIVCRMFSGSTARDLPPVYLDLIPCAEGMEWDAIMGSHDDEIAPELDFSVMWCSRRPL